VTEAALPTPEGSLHRKELLEIQRVDSQADFDTDAVTERSKLKNVPYFCIRIAPVAGPTADEFETETPPESTYEKTPETLLATTTPALFTTAAATFVIAA